MKNKDLGFNKEQVATLDYPSEDTLILKKIPAIKNDFLSSPMISKFATADQVVGAASRRGFFVKGKTGINQTVLNLSYGDYDYLDLMGIKFVEGRNFSKDFKTDNMNFILNEAAVKFLKLSTPIGTELSLDLNNNYGRVIGVIKDFNYKSPHALIDPLAIALVSSGSGPGTKILVKLQTKSIPASIEFIEQKWKQYFPQYPVRYAFLDELFNKQYHKDETMLKIFGCFSGLTIFISCLGLFGLASYTTEQRRKEIGIRKVLGASVTNITYLVSKDFVLLVLVGIAIASPLAYYAVNKWLENYAYRISITTGVFIFGGCLAILVAFITVGMQAIKAAIANPTTSLRTD
jgi:putative ABC transport system permease protein